ncbi:MAG: helix-hairpin-helix domain-containing protein [Candidatus Promineifilaceae bacterium]
MSGKVSNEAIAQLLERIADLLQAQDANTFRVRAYRNGAQTVRDTEQSLEQMVLSGDGQALAELPDIGQGLAATISEYVRTGHSNVLSRLEGEVSPACLFTKIPGIGPELAERIVDELDVQSLEQLEQAAHDGRLAKVEGFGPRRVRAVQVSLAGMLSTSAQRRQRQAFESDKPKQPAVSLLIEIDAEYRRRAETGELKTIAPKRFNPENEAWLPIMHVDREDWSFTALYSNTARAHELGKTHDWVVIYYEGDGQEGQCTVVTETHGPLQGKRVVRGREKASQRYYESGDKS